MNNPQIKLYYEEGSNSSNRVKWSLDYKKIDYKLINASNIDIEAYKKINPFVRIPGMLVNNIPLSESVAMIELIEEFYPNPELFPKDIITRAKVREICEIVNATIHPVQNSKVPLFFIPSLSKSEVQAYRIKWIKQNLEKLLPMLFLKTQFAVEDCFTIADIFVICIYHKGLEMGIDNNHFQTLNNHIEYCLSFPEIKSSCPIKQLNT